MNAQVYVKRRENKLKQADVAKVLNIHKQSYYLKETGQRDFNETEMKRLARYYGCTLNDLFQE